jgi:hypothetical protein
MWLPTSWSFPAQLASNSPRACTDLNQRPEMPTIPRNANGSSHDEHQPPAAENAWGVAAKTRDARGARRPGRSTKTLFPHHQHLPCVRVGNTHGPELAVSKQRYLGFLAARPAEWRSYMRPGSAKCRFPRSCRLEFEMQQRDLARP